MNRLLASIGGLFLVIFVLDGEAGLSATVQQANSGHDLQAVLDGPRSVVFDTARDSCELIDIPDAAAHAFRDYKGTVHLVASHYIRASLLLLWSIREQLGASFLDGKDADALAVPSTPTGEMLYARQPGSDARYREAQLPSGIQLQARRKSCRF